MEAIQEQQVRDSIEIWWQLKEQSEEIKQIKHALQARGIQIDVGDKGVGASSLRGH